MTLFPHKRGAAADDGEYELHELRLRPVAMTRDLRRRQAEEAVRKRYGIKRRKYARIL